MYETLTNEFMVYCLPRNVENYKIWKIFYWRFIYMMLFMYVCKYIYMYMYIYMYIYITSVISVFDVRHLTGCVAPCKLFPQMDEGFKEQRILIKWNSSAENNFQWFGGHCEQ